VLLSETWKETASALSIQKGSSAFEIKCIGWIFLALKKKWIVVLTILN